MRREIKPDAWLDHLRLAGGLQVRIQNDPCANLRVYHKQLVKELYGKRGVICTVLKEGPVQVGDRIEVIRKSA
jgi:MOSC domain-containing protein YiiM